MGQSRVLETHVAVGISTGVEFFRGRAKLPFEMFARL
ncbi:MAG: Uncharacterised protein [Flavobacteriia bacterium]|nr:MAG: Uncharacterised protein [Flavobacteriia bacterium]